MKALNYKSVKYPTEYEARSVEYPHLTWIADTKEKALESVQEEVFRFLLVSGCQFGLTNIISMTY